MANLSEYPTSLLKEVLQLLKEKEVKENARP